MIKQPILGLKADHITKLAIAIHAEAQRNKGAEMVFQIITFAQDWIATHVVPPVEVVGSLATEMNKRASEEERVSGIPPCSIVTIDLSKAKKQREEEEAELQEERAAQLAQELDEQIRADAYRQQLERERIQQARKRAMSDATEMPHSEEAALTESFGKNIEWRGVTFNKVRLFHPRQGAVPNEFH